MTFLEGGGVTWSAGGAGCVFASPFAGDVGEGYACFTDFCVEVCAAAGGGGAADGSKGGGAGEGGE